MIPVKLELYPGLLNVPPDNDSLRRRSAYNWEENEWTVPINAMISQILKIGKQPFGIQLGGRYYAGGPSGSPDWACGSPSRSFYPTGKTRPRASRQQKLLEIEHSSPNEI